MSERRRRFTGHATATGLGPTVLVVEPDRAVQRTVSEFLEGEGFRVLGEIDGRWALRTFEARPIDAVVLDVQLPGLDGLALADAIRRTTDGRVAGLVFLCPAGNVPRWEEAAAVRGALGVLGKGPVALGELRRVLALCLQSRYPAPRIGTGTQELSMPDGVPRSRTTPPREEADSAKLADSAQRRERIEVEDELSASIPTHGLRWGRLEGARFPRLLHDLYRRQMTGALYVRWEEAKKIVYIRGGRPVAVKSNLLSECLGRILVRERMISEDECEESLRLMRSSRRQQGTVLIEMGCISPHNLSFALDLQLRQKLYDIFSWRGGEFAFADGHEPVALHHAFDCSPGELIREGLYASFDEERVRGELAPFAHRLLRLAPDPLYRFQDLGLDDAERRFLENVRKLEGRLAVGHILEAEPSRSSSTAPSGGGAPARLEPLRRRQLLLALLASEVLQLGEAVASPEDSLVFSGRVRVEPPSDSDVSTPVAKSGPLDPAVPSDPSLSAPATTDSAPNPSDLEGERRARTDPRASLARAAQAGTARIAGVPRGAMMDAGAYGLDDDTLTDKRATVTEVASGDVMAEGPVPLLAYDVDSEFDTTAHDRLLPAADHPGSAADHPGSAAGDPSGETPTPQDPETPVSDLSSAHLDPLTPVVEPAPTDIDATRGEGIVMPSAGTRGRVDTSPPGRPRGRTALVRNLEVMRGGSAADILGVDPTASPDALRSAYEELAAELHPDRFRDSAAEVRAAAEVALQVATAAYEYLTQERKPAPALTAEQGGIVAKVIEGERHYRRGRAHLEAGRHLAAREAFRRAVDLAGEEAEYHALLAWTTFLATPVDEGAIAIAREHLDRAGDLAPNFDRVHVYRGYIFKERGDRARAEEEFERALMCNPDCIEALVELQLARGGTGPGIPRPPGEPPGAH